MFLAVLDIGASEAGRDFGAKVAAVEGEDARVACCQPRLNAVDAHGAADVGQRYRGAATDGGIEVAVVRWL